MTRSVLPPLGDSGLHFWITHAVARANGVRFSEAMARGALDKSDYAALVTRCRGCLHAQDCLAALAAPGGLTGVPGYCANRDVLEDLAALA
jgi:hypothetical protein